MVHSKHSTGKNLKGEWHKWRNNNAGPLLLLLWWKSTARVINLSPFRKPTPVIASTREFSLEGDARLGKNKTEFKSPIQSAFPVCHMPYTVILKIFRPEICQIQKHSTHMVIAQLINKIHDLSDWVAWDRRVHEKHANFSEENRNKHLQNVFYEKRYFLRIILLRFMKNSIYAFSYA